jgi:glycosyltransferase involved in cell wall biosynthesis
MAMGKAVVNSMNMDPQGYGRYYPPGYPGLYADERSIKDVLTALLDDPQEVRRRGELGRRWIADNLTPEAIARRHISIYERVLSK